MLCCLFHAGEATDSPDIGVASEPEPTYRTVRQSSAIHFNAALGNWKASSQKPARGMQTPSAMPKASAVPQSYAAQPASVAKAVPESYAAQPASGNKVEGRQTAGKGMAVAQSVSSSLSDLRPRSSSGIPQRITVDRGPATGVLQHDMLRAAIHALSCCYMLTRVIVYTSIVSQSPMHFCSRDIMPESPSSLGYAFLQHLSTGG